ncbi:MAG: translation initiation factor IF-6 [archaeon]
MNITRIKIMGSNYAGLFGICNDTLAFLPAQIDKKTEDEIAKVLDVKTVKTTIYGSSLLSVFSKMNNKHIYLPNFVQSNELEVIEKEIKAIVLNTENAFGNLCELNDLGAIASRSLDTKSVLELKKSGLKITQMNIARTEVVGSALVATNRGFLVNPNTTREEAMQIEETLGVKGGSSTANTGDSFVRNSVIANKKGIILGERTTPFEINRIEEALEQ